MLATALVAAVVVLAGLLGYTYYTSVNTNSSQTNRISGLQATLEKDNVTLGADNSEISALQSQISSDKAQIASLKGQVESNQTQLASLESQVATDQDTISNLNATATSDALQITSLQNQVSSDQSLISNMTKKVSSLQSQISADNSTISALQLEVTTLQGKNLSGEFSETPDCSSGSCIYQITGAVANFGAATANSSTVSFNFYPEPGLAGQIVCQTTVVLGNIPGYTIIALPPATCTSSSSTQAQSWGWAFSTVGAEG